MSEIFPADSNPYNQTFHGFFGTFGTGAGAQIFYVQSALLPSELDKVTLISDIPGSETWSVRDLFQRDVDTERVTNSILPYFQDPNKVKFFNPLTLTILPVDPKTHEIEGDIPFVKEASIEDGGTAWPTLEMSGIYRYRYPSNRPQFGRVEWNDNRARIVAIDGQHRLSALKRFMADPKNTDIKGEFLQWKIPVVIFSLRALTEQGTHNRILDVVRSIFIYINTAARIPNEARQILLSDESVDGLCAQELLEHSHENDVKQLSDRNESIMPLLFFDWRGEEIEGKRKRSPAALKTIEEIRDWFREYLLGEDFSMQQQAALSINPVDPIHSAFHRKRLDPTSAGLIRKRFRDDLLPALTHLLSNFDPYRHYIHALREIEAKYTNKSDVAAHAFHKLRFGTHRGGESLEPQIEKITRDILHDISDAVLKLPRLISMDIGARAMVSAFAQLKPYFDKQINATSSWLSYSQWFTKCLNAAYSSKYLTESNADSHALRLHIAHDHNDQVVNYRLQDVADSYGAYVALFCAANGRKLTGTPDQEAWDKIWEECADKLTNVLLRGYKKQVRVLLKEEHPNGGKPLTEAVKKEATRRQEEHIGKLEKRLMAIWK